MSSKKMFLKRPMTRCCKFLLFRKKNILQLPNCKFRSQNETNGRVLVLTIKRAEPIIFYRSKITTFTNWKALKQNTVASKFLYKPHVKYGRLPYDYLKLKDVSHKTSNTYINKIFLKQSILPKNCQTWYIIFELISSVIYKWFILRH